MAGARTQSHHPSATPVTMTSGTVAHHRLTYLTFISVKEVNRCSGLTALLSHVLTVGLIERSLTCFSFGIWERSGFSQFCCRLTLSWWSAEQEPCFQVTVLTGRLGRARSLVGWLFWCCCSLSSLFPQQGSGPRPFSMTHMSPELISPTSLLNCTLHSLSVAPLSERTM